MWGDRTYPAHCPYGLPGDRLWVRETWAEVPSAGGATEVVYAADYTDGSDRAAGVKYRPSIFMPREYSRITLEVTGVRVERLQDMTAPDAVAEGVLELVPPDNRGEGLTPGALAAAAVATVASMDRVTRRGFLASALGAALGIVAGVKPWEPASGRLRRAPTPVEVFRIGWDSINARRGYGWDTNPWVWVVKFRRCEPGIGP